MGDIIAFDRFTVSRTARQLCLNGHPVAVSSPGVRLLLTLLDRPGKVMSKDELMTLVWGSSPVTENALHVQVAALRKVIGRHHIITRSGIGYQFMGDLGDVAGHALPDEILVGRETLLGEIRRAMERSWFVTLTGPAGVGKTSVARAFAAMCPGRFDEGACLVELAAARDEAGLIDAIRDAIEDGPVAGTQTLAELCTELRPRRMLLVLDTCEHLLACVSRLAEALRGADASLGECSLGECSLGVVATSRQALVCAGEQVIAVPPLPVPDATGDLAGLRASPACRLFIRHMAALAPGMQITDARMKLVAKICRALDGLPLALEIVAGWASLLGLEAVATRLDGAHIGWTHGRATAPARHRTLRDAFDWGGERLSRSERVVLARLSVFADAFTLDSAESVAADGTLSAADLFAALAGLIGKSLVARIGGSAPAAYRLLRTTRAWASELLAQSGEVSAIRARHARALLDWLVEAERDWDTLGGDPWLARHGRLLADLRMALGWSLEGDGDVAAGVAIASASWPFWREMSLRAEGAAWIGQALRKLPPETPESTQAQLRFGLAMMLNDSDWQQAHAAFDQAASLYRRIGDRYRLGRTLQHVAFTQFLLGDADGAERILDQAGILLQDSGSGRALAAVFGIRLLLLSERRDYDGAYESGRQAVRLYEAMGAERSAFAARCNLLDVALCRNDVARAVADGEVLAGQLRRASHPDVLGVVLVKLVAALVRSEAFERALALAQEAAPLLSQHKKLALLLDHLALRCAMIGRARDAALVAGYADAAYARRAHRRQHVEDAAARKLRDLLPRLLPAPDLDRLLQDGAQLPELAAWSIAAEQGGELADHA